MVIKLDIKDFIEISGFMTLFESLLNMHNKNLRFIWFRGLVILENQIYRDNYKKLKSLSLFITLSLVTIVCRNK